MIDYLLSHLNSAAPGAVWPALPGGEAAAMLAMQYQLDRGQFLPEAWIRAQQLRQAAVLAGYAAQAVPFYRERIPRDLLTRAPTGRPGGASR